MFSSLFAIPPRDRNMLTGYQGQSMARLTMLLTALALGLTVLSILTTSLREMLLSVVILTVTFAAIYIINWSGRLQLAVISLLTLMTLAPIFFALELGSPVPSIFFLSIAVVVSAAFGNPRSPIIWATILTFVPLVINVLLYQSPLPPGDSIAQPNGARLAPLLFLEIQGVAIMWTLAGASYLTTRMLYQSIDENSAATAQAREAQQALLAQQDDLATQNTELRQARQRLEALVEALAVPVVPIADGIGLLPLVGPVDATRMAEVERTTLSIVAGRRLRALVIDLSGTKGLEASGAQALVQLCAALRLLGVTPMLAGLGVQGALLLSTANVALPPTAATVQDALANLQGVVCYEV